MTALDSRGVSRHTIIDIYIQQRPEEEDREVFDRHPYLGYWAGELDLDPAREFGLGRDREQEGPLELVDRGDFSHEGV